MAVTDLTDSLPYWARQGVGYGGGPGPTGGPGAAPQGAGGSAAWLQYLQQMFGPGAAQAAQNGGNPHGDGPPGPVSANPLLGSSVGMNPPQPPGPAAPMRPPNSPGKQPGALSSGALGAFNHMPAPQNPGPAASNMPFPGQVDPRGYFAPSAPPAPTQGAANPLASAGPGAAAPVPGPMASGGASAMGASSNPRFVGIDQPNASPQNSMRGGPQGTALNLAGLFGGGAPGRAPGRVAGPMAKGQGGAPSGDDWSIDPATGEVVPNPDVGKIDLRSKAPSNYGPLQRGRTFGYKGGIPT